MTAFESERRAHRKAPNDGGCTHGPKWVEHKLKIVVENFRRRRGLDWLRALREGPENVGRGQLQVP
jgi:hypothetical protein